MMYASIRACLKRERGMREGLGEEWKDGVSAGSLCSTAVIPVTSQGRRHSGLCYRRDMWCVRHRMCVFTETTTLKMCPFCSKIDFETVFCMAYLNILLTICSDPKTLGADLLHWFALIPCSESVQLWGILFVNEMTFPDPIRLWKDKCVCTHLRLWVFVSECMCASVCLNRLGSLRAELVTPDLSASIPDKL